MPRMIVALFGISLLTASFVLPAVSLWFLAMFIPGLAVGTFLIVDAVKDGGPGDIYTPSIPLNIKGGRKKKLERHRLALEEHLRYLPDDNPYGEILECEIEQIKALEAAMVEQERNEEIIRLSRKTRHIIKKEIGE